MLEAEAQSEFAFSSKKSFTPFQTNAVFDPVKVRDGVKREKLINPDESNLKADKGKCGKC